MTIDSRLALIEATIEQLTIDAEAMDKAGTYNRSNPAYVKMQADYQALTNEHCDLCLRGARVGFNAAI